MLIFYDILVILIFALVVLRSKSREAAFCVLAYAASSVFAWSPAFDYFSPYYSYIHIFYAMIFGAFITKLRANFYSALALWICVIFHLVASIDYLFYPYVDTIIKVNYIYFHIALVFCLIHLSTKKGNNNDGNSNPANYYYSNSLAGVQCATQYIQNLENGEKWK